MNKISPLYWVLVADSGNARILQLRREPAECHQVDMLTSPSQHLTTHEMVSDAKGRDFHHHGGVGNTMQPRGDAHDLAEQAFCGTMVDKLEHAANQEKFERLAIIADPTTLGRLRKLMSKRLAERVKLELTRDLVKLPVKSLGERIRSELGWQD
jgi:protein required for attachment to host cells